MSEVTHTLGAFVVADDNLEASRVQDQSRSPSLLSEELQQELGAIQEVQRRANATPDLAEGVAAGSGENSLRLSVRPGWAVLASNDSAVESIQDQVERHVPIVTRSVPVNLHTDDDDLVRNQMQTEVRGYVERVRERLGLESTAVITPELALQCSLPSNLFANACSYLEPNVERSPEAVRAAGMLISQDLEDFMCTVFLVGALNVPLHQIGLLAKLPFDPVQSCAKVASALRAEASRIIAFEESIQSQCLAHWRDQLAHVNLSFASLEKSRFSTSRKGHSGCVSEGAEVMDSSSRSPDLEMCVACSTGLLLSAQIFFSDQRTQSEGLSNLVDFVKSAETSASSASLPRIIFATGSRGQMELTEHVSALKNAEIVFVERSDSGSTKRNASALTQCGPAVGVPSGQGISCRALFAESRVNNGSEGTASVDKAHAAFIEVQQQGVHHVRRGEFFWTGFPCQTLLDWSLCFRQTYYKRDQDGAGQGAESLYIVHEGLRVLSTPDAAWDQNADWALARLFHIDEHVAADLATSSTFSSSSSQYPDFAPWQDSNLEQDSRSKRRKVVPDPPNERTRENFFHHAMRHWFPTNRSPFDSKAVVVTDKLEAALKLCGWKLEQPRYFGLVESPKVPCAAISALTLASITLHGTISLLRESVVVEHVGRLAIDPTYFEANEKSLVCNDDSKTFRVAVKSDKARVRVRHKCAVAGTKYALLVSEERPILLVHVGETTRARILEGIANVATQYLPFAFPEQRTSVNRADIPRIRAEEGTDLYAGARDFYTFETRVLLWRAQRLRMDSKPRSPHTSLSLVPRVAGLWELILSASAPPHREIQIFMTRFVAHCLSGEESLAMQKLALVCFQVAFNAWRTYALASRFEAIMVTKSHKDLQRELQTSRPLSSFLLDLCSGMASAGGERQTAAHLEQQQPQPSQERHQTESSLWGAHGSGEGSHFDPPANEDIGTTHDEASLYHHQQQQQSQDSAIALAQSRGSQHQGSQRLVAVEGAKYNRIHAANTVEGSRTRLNSTLQHFHVYAPPRKGKDVARLSCAICCRLCASGKDHEYRVGRGTSKWCSVCHVALCKRCFHPFHSLRKIPVPKCLAARDMKATSSADIPWGENEVETSLPSSKHDGTANKNVAAVGESGARRLSAPMITYTESANTVGSMEDMASSMQQAHLHLQHLNQQQQQQQVPAHHETRTSALAERNSRIRLQQHQRQHQHQQQQQQQVSHQHQQDSQRHNRENDELYGTSSL